LWRGIPHGGVGKDAHHPARTGGSRVHQPGVGKHRRARKVGKADRLLQRSAERVNERQAHRNDRLCDRVVAGIQGGIWSAGRPHEDRIEPVAVLQSCRQPDNLLGRQLVVNITAADAQYKEAICRQLAFVQPGFRIIQQRCGRLKLGVRKRRRHVDPQRGEQPRHALALVKRFVRHKCIRHPLNLRRVFRVAQQSRRLCIARAGNGAVGFVTAAHNRAINMLAPQIPVHLELSQRNARINPAPHTRSPVNPAAIDARVAIDDPCVVFITE
jgi:hypothetical protein